MARILSKFDREDIEELVKLGKFSNPEATAFLGEVLEQRLRKILDRYLTRLSSVSDMHAVGDKICGTDLALRRHLKPDAEFKYRARVMGGAPLTDIDAVNNGDVCITVPHAAPDGGAPDDAASRYRIIQLWNGVSKGRLETHVYDLGPGRGYKVVAVQRPEP